MAATKRSDWMETLEEALERTYRERWSRTRDGGKCLYSQAKKAVETVLTVHLGPDNEGARPGVPVGDIGDRDVQVATSRWYNEGLAPATINKRLNCLSAMGVGVEGHRPPKSRALKWWLTDAEKRRALAWCHAEDYAMQGDGAKMLNHIEWTTLTGLRVEETLRLDHYSFEWRHRPEYHDPSSVIGSDHYAAAVIVPGLKTSTSQATLPLGAQAQVAATALLAVHFTDYTTLEATWRKLRKAMGWPKEATLKGLRRTAARYLHVDCGMPLDMVRQYLRHENIATTMEYLRLTGGYNQEEMRRYLDKEERP